jgi:hypothetical protein
MIIKFLKGIAVYIAVFVMGTCFFGRNTDTYYKFCISVGFLVELCISILDDIYENTKGKK